MMVLILSYLSSAALKVASYLPLPYSVLSSLLIVPIPLQDAVYDYIAKNRYDWFGKDDECIVKFLSASSIERKCLVVVPAIASSDHIFGCDVAQHCRQEM
jgi:hypothetical protein